jgi:signal peptidase I
LSRVKTLSIPSTFGTPGLALNDTLPAAPLALGLLGAVPVTLVRRRLRIRRSST